MNCDKNCGHPAQAASDQDAAENEPKGCRAKFDQETVKETEREVMEMSENYADQLLREAAEFIDRDRGLPGFLDRFTGVIPGSTRRAGQALDEALSARARAGKVRFAVGAGDIRRELTSSGASLTTCVLASDDGYLAASMQLVDVSQRPVAGAALRVSDLSGQRVVVTDRVGRADLRASGCSVFIQIGDYGGARGPDDQESAPDVVPLPSARGRSNLELAATSGEERAAPSATRPDQLPTEAGGVAFWRHARKGGYDLTLLLRGGPAELTGKAEGTHGVQFVTWGTCGAARRWIVPLSPSPLGLSGSLYGTDEDWLDPASVRVHGAEDLIRDLGDQLDEVIGRSVRHADAERSWLALSRRLDPGRNRSVVEAALAHRKSLS